VTDLHCVSAALKLSLPGVNSASGCWFYYCQQIIGQESCGDEYLTQGTDWGRRMRVLRDEGKALAH